MVVSKHKLQIGTFKGVDAFANFISTLYKLGLTTATDVAMRNIMGGGFEVVLTGEQYEQNNNKK